MKAWPLHMYETGHRIRGGQVRERTHLVYKLAPAHSKEAVKSCKQSAGTSITMIRLSLLHRDVNQYLASLPKPALMVDIAIARIASEAGMRVILANKVVP